MRTFLMLLASWVVWGHLGVAFAEPDPQRVDTGMRQTETATFAGGCFWCMEGPFDKLDGVIETTVGYTGGTEEHPTYQDVSSGTTGHCESVEITYDPSKVTYQKLLEVFWRQIDPTQVDGQFADQGRQYRTAIFYRDETQKRLALESKARLEQSGKFEQPIVTEFIPVSTFYPAEDYHQDYYKQHPLQYRLYRIGSGRDGYLKTTWGNVAH